MRDMDNDDAPAVILYAVGAIVLLAVVMAAYALYKAVGG